MNGAKSMDLERFEVVIAIAQVLGN